MNEIISERARDFANRLIAWSYDFEKADISEMNEMMISFEALKSEFDELAGREE